MTFQNDYFESFHKKTNYIYVVDFEQRIIFSKYHHKIHIILKKNKK